jgi:ubiquinone/menaquinone biosynthesis C-methylase UbiE
MSSSAETLKKEAEFHNMRFGQEKDLRASLGKYYSVNKIVNESYFSIIKNNSKSKKLLEYGCGNGFNINKWIEFGAKPYGIDISEDGIKESKKIAKQYNYGKNFSVMNAEDMTIEDNFFDIVVGTGILHHLSLEKSLKELSRVTKNDGISVFVEPLGHNPFINLFRKLTPKMRTDDEHPLKEADIRLAKKYFGIVQTNYYILFSLLAVPLRNTRIFKNVLNLLNKLDSILFKLPFVRKYAWMTVITLKEPKY